MIPASRLPSLSPAERYALLNRQARLDPRLYPGTRLDALRRLDYDALKAAADAGDELAQAELPAFAVWERLTALEQRGRALAEREWREA